MVDSPIAMSSRLRRYVRRPRADVVVTTVTTILVLALVAVPLTLLVWRSFTPGGELSLDAYRTAFSGVPLLDVAWTTAAFALGSTALALVVGATLAFVFVRTDLPARRLLLVVALAPLALPGVLQTIAWIFLAAPESGLLSTIPGVPSVFGLGGMVIVEGLRLAPLALLLVAAALRSGDPALEEAAVVAGARRAAVIRRVTLPLLRPALLAATLLLVLRCVGSFEVPALLGIPERTWVFTSRVWLALGSSGIDPSAAAASSMPLLGVTLAGTLLLVLVLRRPRTYAVVTGKAFRHRPLELGRWRIPVLGAVTAYLLLTVALPLAALAWMSTQPFLARPSGAALGRADLGAYSRLLEDDVTLGAIRNSILFSALAGVIATALATVVVWTALRARSRARHTLDVLAFLPIAVPGLVLGIGLLQLFLRTPVVLYATAAALVLGYVARYLPYSTRIAGAGLGRLGREHEEAARVGGARWWPTLRRVTLPLAATAIAAAWLATFAVALTDVSLSLVLSSPGNEVIGVRIWALYEGGEWDDLAALGVVTIAGIAILGAATATLGRIAARRARALA